jgi:hypothetical protein
MDSGPCAQSSTEPEMHKAPNVDATWFRNQGESLEHGTWKNPAERAEL